MKKRICIVLLLEILLLSLFPFPYNLKVKAAVTLSSFEIAATGNDGYALCGDDVYANARDGSGAYKYASVTSITDYFGQRYATVGYDYYIYRTFLRWDTSALPDDLVFDNASIVVKKTYDQSATEFYYSATNWIWDGSSPISSSTFTEVEDTILDDQTVDSTGSGLQEIVLINYTCINLTGWTSLSLRSNREIDSTVPTEYEYVGVEDYSNTGTDEAKLKVAWHVPTPEASDVGATSHQANCSSTFHANWTAGDTETMSHWVFGSNISGSFMNDSVRSFQEELLVNITGASVTQDWLFNEHPTAETLRSADGQGLTLEKPDPYNITGFSMYMKKTGSPNCNLTAGIYSMTGSIPNSVPSTIWPDIQNSTTIINSTTLTTDYAWYRFEFPGNITMNPDDYYGFTILVLDEVTLDVSNYIVIEEISGGVYADGNEYGYWSSAWAPLSTTIVFRIKLYGVYYMGDDTWSNVTKTLTAKVGAAIQFAFYANNSYGKWGSTGLQTFITVGVNFTFYFSYMGIFHIHSDSLLDCLNVANSSTHGLANGSIMQLLGAPYNATYYWQSFSWDAGNSIINGYNVTVLQDMEGYDFWSHFALTPTGEPPSEPDYTDIGDVAEVMIAGLIFGVIFIFALAILMRRK